MHANVTVYLNDTVVSYDFENASVLYTGNWVHVETDDDEMTIFPARRIHKVVCSE